MTTKFHTLPLNNGDTFFMNDGKTIRECTFIGVGLTYTDCFLAVIYFLNEDNEFCSFKKNIYTEHIKFYKTLEDAMYDQNNILPRYASILDNDAIQKFMEECGYECNENSKYGVYAYAFIDNSVKKICVGIEISMNRFGQPNLSLNRGCGVWKTAKECLEANSRRIVVKMKKKPTKQYCVTFERIYRGKIMIDSETADVDAIIEKAFEEESNAEAFIDEINVRTIMDENDNVIFMD